MNIDKNFSTKVKPLSIAIALTLSPAIAISAPDDINLNFANSTTTQVNGVDFNFTCNIGSMPLGGDMPAGREFRMCDPVGVLGGGLPDKKDTINGTEVWSFDSITGSMTGVSNTGTTGGINATVASYVDAGYILPTADRDGGFAIDQGADFFSSSFGFLAPFIGSETVTAGSPHANDVGHGAASITFDTVNSEVTIHFPVLEAQWSGTHFLIGMEGSKGVTLKGPVTNVVAGGGGAGVSSFDYKISGEAKIEANDDAGAAGFGDWSPAWIMQGSGTAPDSIFSALPNSPATSAGAIGPTPSGPADGNTFNDGRISLAESEAAFGADTGAELAEGTVFTNPCNGSCFDFTITGLTGAANETAEVVLPLATPIPANAIYRKYNATQGWHTFDESAGDTVESGQGTGTPVDCSAAVFASGLTTGNDCVRLTILNGGPNDNDGALDTTIMDPGGVASAVIPVDNSIAGQSIGDADGCSVSSKPVSPLDKADWWIVAAFLSLLGYRKYKKGQA